MSEPFNTYSLGAEHPMGPQVEEYSDKETAISSSAAIRPYDSADCSIFSADREFVILARREAELEVPTVCVSLCV